VAHGGAAERTSGLRPYDDRAGRGGPVRHGARDIEEVTQDSIDALARRIADELRDADRGTRYVACVGRLPSLLKAVRAVASITEALAELGRLQSADPHLLGYVLEERTGRVVDYLPPPEGWRP
jgi:hypothetical protein